MSELLCTELSTIPISSRLHHDHRRLAILLEQEERFMPNISYPHLCGTVSEEERTGMLEVIYEAVCWDPRQSDAYHLAVNLLDRFLSYETVRTEKDFPAIAGACAMISMKIRRARKECLDYEQLRRHFCRISERSIRIKEKEIATRLKWNLNAVTAADFIEELSRRLIHLLPSSTHDKLIHHSHTLANMCLLYHSFLKVPPSLLACACLSDAVAHMASDSFSKCVELLAQLCGVEQDVLLQHQKNVSAIFSQKLQSLQSCCADTYTPTDIDDIESQEFGPKFTFSSDIP